MRFQEKLKDVFLTQGFAENPDIYKKYGIDGHPAIDYSVGDEQDVLCLEEGDVSYVGNDAIVVISEDKEITYGHGENVCVKNGDHVMVGQKLCEQGSKRGNSIIGRDTEIETWYSHVHYTVREIMRGLKETKDYPYNYAVHSAIPYSVLECNTEMAHFVDPSQFFDKVMYRIADVIEQKEDMDPSFNNPGALRWSPFQSGTINNFATFSTYKRGYNALIHQIRIVVDGTSPAYTREAERMGLKSSSDLSIKQFFEIYAPTSDGNDPLTYAKQVVERSGLMDILHPISDWGLTEVEWLKKYRYLQYIASGADSGNPIMNAILHRFRYLWNMIFGKKVEGLTNT